MISESEWDIGHGIFSNVIFYDLPRGIVFCPLTRILFPVTMFSDVDDDWSPSLDIEEVLNEQLLEWPSDTDDTTFTTDDAASTVSPHEDSQSVSEESEMSIVTSNFRTAESSDMKMMELIVESHAERLEEAKETLRWKMSESRRLHDKLHSVTMHAKNVNTKLGAVQVEARRVQAQLRQAVSREKKKRANAVRKKEKELYELKTKLVESEKREVEWKTKFENTKVKTKSSLDTTYNLLSLQETEIQQLQSVVRSTPRSKRHREYSQWRRRLQNMEHMGVLKTVRVVSKDHVCDVMLMMSNPEEHKTSELTTLGQVLNSNMDLETKLKSTMEKVKSLETDLEATTQRWKAQEQIASKNHVECELLKLELDIIKEPSRTPQPVVQQQQVNLRKSPRKHRKPR